MLFLAAPVLWAQTGTVETEITGRARQLLESARLSDRAWGARMVAGLRLSPLNGLLIEELRRCEKLREAPTDGPEYAYIQALFDSLIELGIEVPADAIAPLRSRWRTEAIILLSRGRDNTSTLLEMQAEESSDIEWLAVSNLLLDRRSKKLFERMLDGFPVTHEFIVLDREEPYGRPGGHGDGFPGTAPRRSFPSDFPAISLYRLSLADWIRTVPLTGGPRRVYYERVVVPAHASAPWPVESYKALARERIEYRLEYLARIGDRPLAEVKRLFQPATGIVWRSTPELTREIEKKLDDQVFDLRNFVIGTKLRDRSDISQVRLEIKPTLSDWRSPGRGPLTPPKPREILLDLR